MLAYSAVGLDILVADFGGAGESRGDALVARLIADGLLHLIQRPAEIDGGRARGGEYLAGMVERFVARAHAQAERDAVSGGRPDQRRPPSPASLRDGARSVLERAQRHNLEPVRQLWSDR